MTHEVYHNEHNHDMTSLRGCEESLPLYFIRCLSLDLVLENMVNAGQLQLELRDRVKEALLRRHRHQHEKHHKGDKNRLPNIRSLVDIGRNSSKSMFGSHSKCDVRLVVSSYAVCFRIRSISKLLILLTFSYMILANAFLSLPPSRSFFPPISNFS